MLLFSGWNKYYPLPFQTQAVGSSPLRFLERRKNWQTFKCKSFLKYPLLQLFENQEGKACQEPGRENTAVAGDAVAVLGLKSEPKRGILFSGTVATTALAGQWQIFEVMGQGIFDIEQQSLIMDKNQIDIHRVINNVYALTQKDKNIFLKWKK